MASDFDHIGFQIKSADEFRRLFSDQAKRWPQISTPVGGAYVRAGGPDGAELWIQISPEGEPFGGHPHFAGASRFNANVSRTMDTDGSPLDGSLLCELVDDQPGVPMLIDVPDYRMHAAWLARGTSAVLQLSAFPREFQLCENESMHAKSPLGKLAASGALIPSGLFKPEGGMIIPPRNHAILAGRVEACRDATNGISGRRFHALTVRTLGGIIDVPLARDAAAITPAPGNIIAGSFSLSGRLIEPLPSAPADIVAVAQREIAKGDTGGRSLREGSKPSILRRIFGR